jgi:hypothetical protein
MELDRINILIDSYFNGTTSREEEQELARYFAECKEIPEEYQVVSAMLSSFNAIAQDRPKSEIELPAKKRGRNILTITHKWLAGAAAAVTLLIGIASVINFSHKDEDIALNTEPSYICYVNGVQVNNDQLAYAEASRILKSMSENVQLAMTEVNRLTNYKIIQ